MDAQLIVSSILCFFLGGFWTFTLLRDFENRYGRAKWYVTLLIVLSTGLLCLIPPTFAYLIASVLP